jgi:hypothetical protein
MYLRIVIVVEGVDSVDRIQKALYMLIYGMAIPDSGWMLGMFPLTEPALPVERIGETHPQVYPQKERFLIQSTSWRLQKAPSIYGGVTLSAVAGHLGLLHSEDHLSTDYRDLSTNSSPGKR